MSRVVEFPVMSYAPSMLDGRALTRIPRGAEGRRGARYDAVSRLVQALAVHDDRAGLFQSLPAELRRLIRFGVLALELYDEHAASVTHVLHPSPGRHRFDRVDGHVSLVHWPADGQPLVISDDGLLRGGEDPRSAHIVQSFVVEHGVRALCVVPLTIRNRRLGLLVAGSDDPNAYASNDPELLSLMGDNVAIALDHVLRVETLERELSIRRERAESLEASDELMCALSAVLDIRKVFPRISEIAAKVLPHDLMTMTFHTEDGDVVVEASSSPTWPVGTRLKCPNPSRMQGDTFKVIDDLDAHTFPVVAPSDFWDRIHAEGYRSMMCVGLKARDQQLGLIFWSTRRAAFTADDRPIARRIADHVALAVSHEQLAAAAQQVAEEHVRAERLEARVRSLTGELEARSGYAHVVGASLEWKAVLKAATQVSATDTTVLLSGESGTGKEVVARFIHRASARGGGPFVAINCAALPEHLLESELFGHERGAFTGAQQAKPGQIELASGGVLFLDEVSEMSPSAQAKFLRVLQEREFQRLGGTRTLKANIRVIAATNRDLKMAVERKEFREDLYYRLQVFDIRIPPLRERVSDILPLTEAFLKEIGETFGRPVAGLTRDARQALLQHQWPGNVRELRNALERAVILCEGSVITPEHLSLAAVETAAARGDAPPIAELRVVEREVIGRALRESNGNKSKAARQLGLSRTQLYGRLRKYQLDA